MLIEDAERAQVVYRASRPSGHVVEIRLAIDANAATVTDAWSRLTDVHPDVDPMSLEIEVRHRSTVTSPIDRDPTPRRLARR
jgi:hypothetical protein